MTHTAAVCRKAPETMALARPLTGTTAQVWAARECTVQKWLAPEIMLMTRPVPGTQAGDSAQDTNGTGSSGTGGNDRSSHRVPPPKGLRGGNILSPGDLYGVLLPG